MKLLNRHWRRTADAAIQSNTQSQQPGKTLDIGGKSAKYRKEHNYFCEKLSEQESIDGSQLRRTVTIIVIQGATAGDQKPDKSDDAPNAKRKYH